MTNSSITAAPTIQRLCRNQGRGPWERCAVQRSTPRGSQVAHRRVASGHDPRDTLQLRDRLQRVPFGRAVLVYAQGSVVAAPPCPDRAVVGQREGPVFSGCDLHGLGRQRHPLGRKEAADGLGPAQLSGAVLAERHDRAVREKDEHVLRCGDLFTYTSVVRLLLQPRLPVEHHRHRHRGRLLAGHRDQEAAIGAPIVAGGTF
jgi:hypothetical protein